jgi:beta-ribofuranosylaminobenzene 5'-phosphate synthase
MEPGRRVLTAVDARRDRRRQQPGEPVPPIDGDASWLEGLAPLQRFLLATDGTVTPALSAYLREPVAVRVLRQDRVALSRPDGGLALAARRTILDRRVVLYGTRSGVVALYADSRIAVERLPAAVHDDLLSGELPIGLVLRRHRVETFRETLGAGRRPATGDAAVHLGPGDVCWRTYAIISGGQPLIVVHEEFPVVPAARVA